MSTPVDLMGVGMPAALANRLGNAVISVTLTGTSAGTAATLQGGHVYVVSAASSQTGGIIDSALSIGQSIVIVPTASTSAVIYPPSGAAFNTSVGSSLTLAQYKNAIVTRLTSTLFSVVVTA